MAERLGKMPVVVGDKAGFIANALLFGYLNHAASMFETQVRHARGHRRRDEARLRPADGSARAARPDRPRHRLRDPRHDVQAGPRPAARAGAGAQADGHRGAARPQDRPRLLHLRGAELPGRRRRRAHARRRPTAPPSAAPGVATVGVVGSGTMATGIVEVFAKAGYDVALRRAQRGQGRHACAARSSARWTRPSPAASSTRRDARRRARPGVGHHAARRPGRPRPRRRGGRRGPRGQDGAVRGARRDLQARRDHRDHDVEPAGHRPRRGHEVPAGRRRPALLQPGAGDEARRGGLHRRHRRRRRRDGGRRVPPARQAPGHLRRPRRLHRQRAAVPLPQRRGARCSRPTTPRPTTSTPR